MLRPNRILMVWAVFVAAHIFGCGAASKPGALEPDAESSEASRGSDPLRAVEDAELRRALTDQLRSLSAHGSPEVRRKVALAVGRIGDARGAGILIGLFADDDSAVRQAAVFATGLLGDRAGAATIEALITVVGEQTDPSLRAAALSALAEVGGPDQVQIVVRSLSNESSKVREAACRALGMLGIRGVAVDGDVGLSIAERLSDDDPAVRRMAAFALGRIAPAQDEPSGVVAALARAFGDEEDEAKRSFALRALAARGKIDQELLGAALARPSSALAGAALLFLPRVPVSKRCELLETPLLKILAQLVEEPVLAYGGFAHTARAALETWQAADCRSDKAAEASRSAEAVLAAAPGVQSAGTARLICLCRAVYGASDVALVACDKGRSEVGKALFVERLARKAAENDKALDTLIESTRDGDLAARVAAINALSTVQTQRARQALIALAGDERSDLLTVAAALEAIAANPAGYRCEADGAELCPGLASLIAGIVERFLGIGHAHAPLLAAATAAAQLGSSENLPAVERLLADERAPVRWAALEAYRVLAKREPPSALPALELYEPFSGESSGEKVKRLRVITTRGAFTVELNQEAAPVTAANLTSLAARDYFDDTPIHRVVPGFVVQMGDPTGTGLGDPGHFVPCEYNPIPYERGTVGMALGGKDTGGSQFFVALSPQPHLTGHYTVFGRVLEGMDVLDLIEVGDRIIDVVAEDEKAP